MPKPSKLLYVFQLYVLSTDGITWIERQRILQLNDCKETERVIAGNIAAHHLQPGINGVRVKFLGLQKDLTKGGKHPQPLYEPITPMNPFTLTLVRDSIEREITPPMPAEHIKVDTPV